MRYFSPSTKGFYGEEHGSNKPNDCIEITENEYNAVSSYDAITKELSFDANGKPILVDKIDNRSYDKKRKTEYPDFKDYLDGIVKGDQAQIDKYIADCQTVKAKYPKGSE